MYMTVLGTVIQVENVDPHPHIDWAFGFSNTNREPIMSSDQSIVVPSKCNIDMLHVYTFTPLGSVCFSTLDTSGEQGSRTYSKPLQPPPLHENNMCGLRLISSSAARFVTRMAIYSKQKTILIDIFH